MSYLPVLARDYAPVLPEIPYPRDKHPAAVYLASVSKSSRRVIEQRLTRCAGLLRAGMNAWTYPWHTVRREHMGALRSLLGESGMAIKTCNACLSAVKRVLATCWELEYFDAETLARATNVKQIAGSDPQKGRALTFGEVQALFGACDLGTSAGLRDACVVALAYGCGLRRQEICDLRLEDYDPKTGDITVVRGKGRKSRVARAPKGAQEALRLWLGRRGAEPGFLLCRTTKGRQGRILPHLPIGTMAVYYLLARLQRRAGLEKFSPHDLRRSFASEVLRNGADVGHLSRVMGHSDVSTTMGYDHRSEEEALSSVSDSVHVPFVARAS